MNPAHLFRPQSGRFISLLVCSALLVSMFVATPRSSAKLPRKLKSTTQPPIPQGNSQRQRQPAPRDNGRKVDPIPPQTGPPAANLPNLDELKRRKPEKPEAPPPVPSTMRKTKRQFVSNSLQSSSQDRNDGPARSESVPGSRAKATVRSHHARFTRSLLKPSLATAPLPQNGRINFALAANGGVASASSVYPAGTGYNPTPAMAINGERTGLVNGAPSWWNDGTPSSWSDWLEVDFDGSKSIDEIDLFTTQDSYLNPAPPTETMTFTLYGLTAFDVQYWNGSGWVTVPGGQVTGNNKVWKKIDFAAITTTKIRVSTNASPDGYSRITELEAWGTPIGGASDSERAMAGLDPFSQPGNQLQARDCEWSLPLVSLPGRAGLDLGLTLSYSSMVWTHAGNSIYFDEDDGNPSPGFRLGFPTLGNLFLDTQANVNARMMVTSSGRHVEFRYTGHYGSYDLYKTGDSSYTELLDYGSSIWLRTTDGTNINFGLSSGEWHATLIRDRNGNMIAAGYNGYGDITSVTDTLGRVINFNYDANANLNTITQTWNGQTHTWASFGWIDPVTGVGPLTMHPSFSGVSVVGTYDGQNIPVLRWVGLPDGSYYKFEYNNSGQVNAIRRYTSDGAPGPSEDVQRSYVTYDYDSPTGDCPRITASHLTAENWQTNVQTTFEDLGSGWHRMTMADGTQYTELYQLAGWQRGLTTQTEVWGKSTPSSPFVRQKLTTTDWTQDNTALSYELNPRVTQTSISDPAGNVRRTEFDYTYYSQYGLPWRVLEYNGGTEVRRTYRNYNLSSDYVDRNIIGLVSLIQVYNVANSQTNPWELKQSFNYDEAGSVNSSAVSAVQHDTSFTSNPVGRGNLTSASSWDVTDIENVTKLHTSHITYDAAGNVLSATDAAGHGSTFIYDDNFFDGVTHGINHNTFAYPTRVNDPDFNASTAPSNYSTAEYNYDFGATTRTQGPPPAGQSSGAVQTITYDDAGRVDRQTIVNTGAYTRYQYGSNYVYAFSTINNAADDAWTFAAWDGLGQTFVTFGTHPNSDGLYQEQITLRDAMGRVYLQSKPTEVDASWTPAGVDTGPWVWTQQTYDWKGRPLRTIHPAEGGYSYYTELSYTGCGCAGGEAVTATDEVGRRRRTTSDVLGRMVKSEELNFDGSVYATADYAYDALEQIKTITHEGQTRTFSYDGYGRLSQRTTPEQGTTTYAYNADDTLQSMTDARQVIANYGYNNNRHLVSSISYDVSHDPTHQAQATPTVSFGYDAAGNRISMHDGLGDATYHYDSLSRMDWEERTLGGFGPYRLTYGYNYANELTSITGPSQFGGVQVAYNYDTNGRLNSVTGSGYGGVTSYASNITYRAFGAVKGMSFGDGKTLSTSYDSRMRPTSWNVSNVLGYNYSYLEHTDKVNYARNVYDGTLDRSYEYDQVGALVFAHSGAEARAAFGIDGTQWGTSDGPYSHEYDYDKQGNMIRRFGWGGEVQGGAPYGGDTNKIYSYSTNKNQRDGFTYDAAGNLTHDEKYTYAYDAPGQQRSAVYLNQSTQSGYDGDGLRNWKSDNGPTTYYLRSTVLGGAVVAELSENGSWTRGYVYQGGGELLAILSNNQVNWVYEDTITKSQRVTNINGGVIQNGVVELDPWGANTSRSSSASAFQPHQISGYTVDSNGGADAMARRYNVGGRFAQPDPYGGSYDFSDPQSLNRYAYAGNDPVNGSDPSGLDSDFGLGLPPPVPILRPRITDRIIININERVDQLLSGGRNGGGIPLRMYRVEPHERDHGGDPQNPGARGQLTGDRLNAYNNARAGALAALKNNADCKKFLLENFGLSAGAVANALRNQRAFDGLTSTISAADAGLIPHSDPGAVYQVRDLFATMGGVITTAIQAAYASREDRGATQRDVYYGEGFDATTVIHEALHSLTGSGDDALDDKAGGNLSTELKNHGCG